MTKTCPFSAGKECNSDCPLFVAPDDLNEFVAARLGSIGVIDRTNGSCSLKVLALSQSRVIFENTKTRG
ncbi:MAG: hypothetical protein E7Z89_07845 [Cyanobacteria bacterium SIG28]|nr:hypothetical protein [Cyanobacteria bacterium SIG28]